MRALPRERAPRGKLNTYITTCGFAQNIFSGEMEPRIIVTKAPLRWFSAYLLCDLLCYHTSHRWCESRLVDWVRRGVRQHEEDFEFAVTEETLNRYAVWRGWTTWEDLAGNDEDDNEYQS